VDSGALADDPNLANYDIYDLTVSLSDGDHIYYSQFHAQLTSGKFYIPPSNDDIFISGQRNFTGFRFLRDDQFVCMPVFSDHAHTTIVGGTGGVTFTIPSNGSNYDDGSGFIPANDQMLVDIAYLDPHPNLRTYPGGVYSIARLPVLRGSAGTIQGLVESDQTFPAHIQFSFTVPEPVFSTLAIAATALATRRRVRP
jgi:hypothetical protein